MDPRQHGKRQAAVPSALLSRKGEESPPCCLRLRNECSSETNIDVVSYIIRPVSVFNGRGAALALASANLPD